MEEECEWAPTPRTALIVKIRKGGAKGNIISNGVFFLQHPLYQGVFFLKTFLQDDMRVSAERDQAEWADLVDSLRERRRRRIFSLHQAPTWGRPPGCEFLACIPSCL